MSSQIWTVAEAKAKFSRTASAASPPVSWKAWPPCPSPRTAMASATTTACSARPSATAGSTNSPRTGSISARPGSFRAPRSITPSASAAWSTARRARMARRRISGGLPRRSRPWPMTRWGRRACPGDRGRQPVQARRHPASRTQLPGAAQHCKRTQQLLCGRSAQGRQHSDHVSVRRPLHIDPRSAAGRHLGLSKLVSIGNKADINENDLLSYFAQDEETKVIVGYLENIVNGDKLIKVADATCSKKPVVILKSGTSKAGQKAAASHTACLPKRMTPMAPPSSHPGRDQGRYLQALTTRPRPSRRASPKGPGPDHHQCRRSRHHGRRRG